MPLPLSPFPQDCPFSPWSGLPQNRNQYHMFGKERQPANEPSSVREKLFFSLGPGPLY